MNKIIICLFLLVTSVAKSQSLPNSFKVGKYCEILPGDTIKIWYHCTGGIANNTCASFYRISKIDKDRVGFTGKFTDYDVKGNILYKAEIIEGYLQGRAFYFYPDGNVREMGMYLKDTRNGVWKYFYDNGRPEKTLNFIDGKPDIIEQYDKDGKALVKDGNGVYSGRTAFYGTCGPGALITGAVKNSKLDGTWKYNGDPAEVYDNGQYIKTMDMVNGVARESAVKKPAMDISGYYPNEGARIAEGPLGCPGGILSSFKYDGQSLVREFYPELIKKIKSYPNLKQQCLIISLEFSKDKIQLVNIYSSKNDQNLKRFVFDYLSVTNKWTHGFSASEKNPPLFFAVNIDPAFGDENVLIPEEIQSRKR
jgi:antitoxin component YwqK of YwqJK toxin-antitoxin module